MQRLRIEHNTRYEYLRPVQFTEHHLVIRPREGHDLRIESMQLRVSPAHEITWVRDVFGNSIAQVNFTEAAATLEIATDVIIHRYPPFPVRTFHDPVKVNFPVTYHPLESTVVGAYLQRTFPEDASPIAAWLGQSLTVDPADTEGTVLALCTIINRTIAYLRRREQGVQTPAQTLQVKSGSCRDMATLMMEAARSLGIAARFASGYLHGTASQAGHASTHAWTEIYLPALGWRGFDPTLGQAISLRHIVVGVSNHPRGVMPVSGGFVGMRSDNRELVVNVRTEELPAH